jgi:hypothetical protein
MTSQVCDNGQGNDHKNVFLKSILFWNDVAWPWKVAGLPKVLLARRVIIQELSQ